jgi:hypothetical protein
MLQRVFFDIQGKQCILEAGHIYILPDDAAAGVL